jgi:hypothetical protein
MTVDHVDIDYSELRLLLVQFQFKRCISYNNPSRNQEGQHIDIHKIRGPGRRLVFTDTGNDRDILACISSVRKARMKGQLIQEKQNKHNRTL